MKRRIVLLGPPASGKGTQAELISSRYGLPITSPGAILRDEKRAGTPLGIEAAQFTSRGMLLPDATIVGLVRTWLENQNSEFIFDGFPRSQGQADSLERLLEERGAPLDAVIALQVDSNILHDRVARRVVCADCGRSLSVGLHVSHASDRCPSCGGTLVRRSDDTPEALGIRLEEYADKTEPLLNYYASKGLLYPVESAATPDTVFESIRKILESE